MRRWRPIVWGGGLLLVLLVAMVARAGDGRHLSWPAIAFVGWLCVALVGETAALVGSLVRGARRTKRPARDAADGIVGHIRIPGIIGEPNRDDSRFRRFTALNENPSSGARSAGGSSPTLLGRITIVSLFIGRDGGRWSDPEIARALASVEAAGRWLEREARRWAAELDVQLADTYFEAEDAAQEVVGITLVAQEHDAGLFEVHASERAMASASRAVGTLGFAGVADWVDQIGARIDADSTVWLLHLRREGRSHAIPQGVSLLPGASLAVCYAREENFPAALSSPVAPDSSTIAHEVLHLFGATDKYGASLAEFPAHAVTAADIMRLEFRSLARMQVDRLSAREIGWAGRK